MRQTLKVHRVLVISSYSEISRLIFCLLGPEQGRMKWGIHRVVVATQCWLKSNFNNKKPNINDRFFSFILKFKGYWVQDNICFVLHPVSLQDCTVSLQGKCFTQQIQQGAVRTHTRFLLMFALQTLETDFHWKVTGADLFPHDCLGYRFPPLAYFSELRKGLIILFGKFRH